MADGEVREGPNCGFCWQMFELMVDPRELPCHHVFCLGCLRGDFSDPSNAPCPVCKKTYNSLKVGGLPAARIEGKSAVSATTTLTCDRASCQGQLAVSYCTDCSAKLCGTHDQKHEALFEEEHRVINIATYEDSPGKYKKPLCGDHNEVLIKACRKCDKLICNECDRQEGECAAGSATHEFVTFAELKDETQSHYDKLVKAFSDKTADIYDLEKVERKELSEEEESCQKMLDGINKIRDKQSKMDKTLLEPCSCKETCKCPSAEEVQKELEAWRKMRATIDTLAMELMEISLDYTRMDAIKRGMVSRNTQVWNMARLVFSLAEAKEKTRQE